jgi:uncharacterized protein
MPPLPFSPGWLWSLPVAAASAWALACAALSLRQRAILYPAPRADRSEQEARGKALGFEPFPPETRGLGGWLGPEPQGPSRGLVIVFHGNSSVALDLAGYAEAFAPLGYRVLLAEYPGYGARPGVPSEFSMARANVVLAQEAARRFPGPLYAVGESLGAAAAARAVGEAPSLFSGLAVFTPWRDLASLAKRRYPWAPVGLLLRERHDSARALAAWRGPLLVVAARSDELIDSAHARALFEGAPSGRKDFWVIEGGHSSWRERLPEGFWSRLTEAAFGAKNGSAGAAPSPEGAPSAPASGKLSD